MEVWKEVLKEMCEFFVIVVGGGLYVVWDCCTIASRNTDSKIFYVGINRPS